MNFAKKAQILIIILIPAVCFGQMEGFHDNTKKNCKFCHIKDDQKPSNQNLFWQTSFQNNYYVPYSSATLDADVSQPLGSSKLCLSCHDGTLALDNLGIHGLTPAQDFGTDLRNSHPVSFKYDSYLASKDAGLHDPVSSPSGLGGTIESDMLVDGNLECISCHDIHGFTKLKHYLIKSNFKSRLCLTCHDK